MNLVLIHSHKRKRHKANQSSHKKELSRKNRQVVKQNNGLQSCASYTNSPVASTYILPYVVTPPTKAFARSRRNPKAPRRFADAVLTKLTYIPYKK